MDGFYAAEDKEGGISKNTFSWGLEKLKREIAKCILLCANCHTKLHYEERRALGGMSYD